MPKWVKIQMIYKKNGKKKVFIDFLKKKIIQISFGIMKLKKLIKMILLLFQNLKKDLKKF